jgi:bifunctional non-homologous end joining protein LigD
LDDLDRYHEKRDFERTPEPEGADDAVADASCEVRGEEAPCGPGLAFVVQKHAASRLHYDFRLEMHGTLVSWAVPKGPSYDPPQKRLAVHVEDHPIEYGSFEGTIPQGEYGGGTVMVWDRGTWEPIGDMDESMAAGQLKFNLHGEKLVGRWVLVRMKPKGNEKAENWLLIKERDEYVRPADEYDVVTARPESAASGRDMEQIAAGEAAPVEPSAEADPEPQDHPASAVRGPLPTDAPLQLATLVDTPPGDEEWLHEIKYDGYRIRCAVEKGETRLLTRNGKDWTDRFPELAAAAAALPVESALLDGEVVVFGSAGVPDFGALQHALSRKDTKRVAYMAFDLLYLNGWDLLDAPLIQRKGLLRTLVDAAGNTPVRFTDHIGGHGERFHRETCTLSLEGSVSKKADAPYRPGRTRDWQKVKCLKRQEFVVGGYTEARGSRHGFGALLLGVREADGLRFAGRVGTGFTDNDLDALSEQLAPLAADASPFAVEPNVRDRALHWVTPEMVVEVSFQEWTEDGLVRHSSFMGVREDIDAADVRRESAAKEAGDASATGTGTPSGASSESASGVRITNPDKVLFPEIGLTKSSLVAYYEAVAEAMLPQMERRPLTLVRCPHGREGECFFQKHPEGKGWPRQVKTVEIAEKGGPAAYSYVEDPAGLIALVQLGALEIHAWNSRVDEPESPDRIIFDLDPGVDVSWETVVSSAELVRDALGALGFTGFAKTTGGKGLHVVVPIAPGLTYDEARALSRGLVDRLAAHDPDAFTAKMAKGARSGRVFVDYLRNAHGATAVRAFSTRARPGAPVSAPVTWEELGGIGDPTAFDTTSTPERLAALTKDPWTGYEDARTSVTDAHFAALGVPRQKRLGE